MKRATTAMMMVIITMTILVAATTATKADIRIVGKEPVEWKYYEGVKVLVVVTPLTVDSRWMQFNNSWELEINGVRPLSGAHVGDTYFAFFDLNAEISAPKSGDRVDFKKRGIADHSFILE